LLIVASSGMRCASNVLDGDQECAAWLESQTLAEQYPADTEMRTVADICPTGDLRKTPNTPLVEVARRLIAAGRGGAGAR
jgi:hypothetical protein